MSFRDNLIHLRAVNNMTQEQLAMLLGVSRQSVTKWESEKSYPEMDKLLKMCQIFGCTLDDLVQGDLTETITKAVVFNQENHQPTDLFGYDEHMTSFAWRIALGVVSPLLGLACAMPLFALGDPEYTVPPLLPENLSAGFGTTFVFAGVIACLALIIPTGMKHSEFVKAHPFLEDFYTQQQKETTRTCFTRQLVGGICSIFAAICLIIFWAILHWAPLLVFRSFSCFLPWVFTALFMEASCFLAPTSLPTTKMLEKCSKPMKLSRSIYRKTKNARS